MRPAATPVDSAPPEPGTLQAVLRGFRGRCPACGEGRLFGRYLKVESACARCGTELHHHRADDFPPYLVMFAVGHIVGYGIYVSETRMEGIPLWLHATVWPTLAIGLCLAFLQPVKGAVVALQYSLGMHGFGGEQPHGARRAVGERGAGRAAAGAGRQHAPPSELAEPDPP